MDHFQHIYNNEAEAYHQLIAAEDVDGNLLPAMQAITSLQNKQILDVGSGTGRIPFLLHDQVQSIVALDRYNAMLQEQQRQQILEGGQWPVIQGDMARLPFGPAGFDVSIAGWVIGHLTSWAADVWPQDAARVFREMERVTRPGGCVMIIETLGTGVAKPAAPTPALAVFYSWLEGKWDFTRKEITTDYQFHNLDEAVALTGFFFGSELAERVRSERWIRVPEWTGIWWKAIDYDL